MGQPDERSSGSSFFVDGMMLSLGLFGTSAYWFVRHVRRHHEFMQGANATPFFKRRQKSLSNLDLRIQKTPGLISERGRTALVPPIPYLTQLLACFQVSVTVLYEDLLVFFHPTQTHPHLFTYISVFFIESLRSHAQPRRLHCPVYGGKQTCDANAGWYVEYGTGGAGTDAQLEKARFRECHFCCTTLALTSLLLFYLFQERCMHTGRLFASFGIRMYMSHVFCPPSHLTFFDLLCPSRLFRKS